MDQQQFISVLAAAAAGDTSAAQQLGNFEDKSFVQYLFLLCQLLSEETTPPNTRLQCIILLSNTVHARSTQQQKVYNSRWLAQGSDVRSAVRTLLLRLLDSPIPAFRETTVKAITAIAVAELPQDQWPELIPQLCAATRGADVNILIRISSIAIIGGCCSALPDECKPLGNHTDQILTSVAVCVSDPNLDLRIAGLKALNNSIKFCTDNFAKPEECQFLMQMMTQSATPQPLDEKVFEKQFEIQACAWDCLSSVVVHHYSILQPFIVDIFNSSVSSIQQSLNAIEDEELRSATHLASIQAIEFWYSLATHEDAIQTAFLECQEHGEQPDDINLRYTNHALEHIAPLLFKSLCLQPEDPNDESYNITLSSLNCLTAFASQADASIFKIVLPLVESSISSPDWRLRDAALTALGCLLSSPAIADETLDISTTLRQAFTVVVQLFKDPSDFVATSSGWCIMQYCRSAPHLVFEVMETVANQALLYTFQTNRRRPTDNICQAIYELAQNISEIEEEHQQEHESNPNPPPFANPLSPYFMPLASSLLKITETATNSQLIANGYEALVSLIQCKAGNGNPHLPELMQLLGQRLHASIQPETSQTYKVQVQGFISAALTHLIYNLPVEHIVTQAPNLLNVFTQCLNADATIVSESLSGVEAIAYRLGVQFAPHADATYSQLIALVNRAPDVGSVVNRALTTLGAILSRSKCYNQNIGDEVVKTIFAVLAVDSSDNTGKLAAVSLFSDLIQVSMDSFVRYYPSVCQSLAALGEVSLTANHVYLDQALAIYLLDLQKALCNAYGAFVINLGREGAPEASFQALATNIEQIITYAIKVVQDSEATSASKSAALTLLADIFACLQDISPPLIAQIAQSKIPQVIMNLKSQKGIVGEMARETWSQWTQLNSFA